MSRELFRRGLIEWNFGSYIVENRRQFEDAVIESGRPLNRTMFLANLSYVLCQWFNNIELAIGEYDFYDVVRTFARQSAMFSKQIFERALTNGILSYAESAGELPVEGVIERFKIHLLNPSMNDDFGEHLARLKKKGRKITLAMSNRVHRDHTSTAPSGDTTPSEETEWNDDARDVVCMTVSMVPYLKKGLFSPTTLRMMFYPGVGFMPIGNLVKDIRLIQQYLPHAFDYVETQVRISS